MADETPSFGRLVLSRAWWSSWRFFEDVRHDLSIGIIAILFAGYRQIDAHGLSASVGDIGSAAMNFFAPFVIVWVCLFIWHLWLAPAALAYEANKSLGSLSQPQLTVTKPKKPVNWNIWKQMDAWTLQQFAAILAKEEPASAQSGSEQQAYVKMIRDDVNSGKLKYIKRYGESQWDGKRYEVPIDDWHTEVKREEALKWVAAHSDFDVSHVQ